LGSSALPMVNCTIAGKIIARNAVVVVTSGLKRTTGSGNSVANYVPVENYLVMLDEGRRWAQ